ncbi:MAG TPA: hypothetical protein DCZ43_05005, partial [candidate division Zixibacteria bacterium]|nr:hypothetical protein [candidate division Zixibacteria bacterium]
MKTVAVDDNVRINLIILVLAVLSIITSFIPQWHLWGLDSVGVLFLPFRLLCLGLLILLAIPAIGSNIGTKFGDWLYSFTGKQLKVIYAILAAVLVILFILLKSNNHLLGDGYNLLGVIKRGNYFSPTEPLDYLLHNMVFSLLGRGDNAAYQSYAICSIACGAIFLTALYYIIKNKVDLILSLAVVFCFTALQFFFGYVENYTFSFLFMFFYSLSAIRDLNARHLSLLTIALLILACAFQLSSISLIPSFIFLLLLNFPGKTKYLIMLGVILACGLLVAGYMILFSQVPLAGIFVPLAKTPSNPYTLFSGQHI